MSIADNPREYDGETTTSPAPLSRIPVETDRAVVAHGWHSEDASRNVLARLRGTSAAEPTGTAAEPESDDILDDLPGAELMLLGHMLSTGATVSPERTRAAIEAVNTAAEYLATALRRRPAVAVPTPTDLAELLLGLHVAAVLLHRGLTALQAAIGRREAPLTEAPIAALATLQAALNMSVEHLSTAAFALADAHGVLVDPVRQR